MDKRRKEKGRVAIAQKQTNKEIGKVLIADKKWLSEKCMKLEESQEKHLHYIKE